MSQNGGLLLELIFFFILSFGTVIFRQGREKCVAKNEKWIIFSKSQYINSNPAKGQFQVAKRNWDNQDHPKLPTGKIKQLFLTSTKSYIDYGTLTWGGAANTHLTKIDRSIYTKNNQTCEV